MMKIFKRFQRQKKDPEELGEEEPSASDIVASRCKILYPDGYAGWSCREGWHELLAEFSYKVEALNLQLYPRYRVRAEIEELKEKFGTLRLTAVATIDPSPWRCFMMRVCKWTFQFLRSNVKYEFKQVIDVPSHIEHVEKQLTKVEYIKQKRSVGNCANAAVFERDGKYFYVADYDKYKQSHDAPTKHKILFKLQKLCQEWSVEWKWATKREHSEKQQVMLQYMNAMLKKFTKEAEDEAYCTCEACGHQIGTDWSPRCETRGWVSYICESCAKKQDGEYYMNDALWQKGECIKTKEQLEQEEKELEAKEEKCHQKYLEEEEAFEKELAAAQDEESSEEEDEEG